MGLFLPVNFNNHAGCTRETADLRDKEGIVELNVPCTDFQHPVKFGTKLHDRLLSSCRRCRSSHQCEDAHDVTKGAPHNG